MSQGAPLEKVDILSRDSGSRDSDEAGASLPFSQLDGRLPAIAFRRAAGEGASLQAAWGGEKVWRRLGVVAPGPSQLSDFAELVHASDRECLTRALENAASQYSGYEVRYRAHAKRDGESWLREEGEPVLDRQGRVVAFEGLIHDVSGGSHALAKTLERQRDVEHTISELARRFLDHSAEDLGEAMLAGVESAATMAAASRAYLVTMKSEPPYEHQVYAWQAPGSAIAPPVINRQQTRKLTWSFDIIRQGQTLHIPDVGALPDDAEPEARDLEARGVGSLLGIPVRSGKRLIGYLCFEREGRKLGWSELEIDPLRLVARIFSSALQRKHAEEELQHSRARLLQSQKMEAVGRLASGIAHDFNNLLTVILGFSQALLEELPQGQAIRDDVSEIRGAAERAAKLTGQLLDFSRPPRAGHRSVDLNETIETLEELLRRLLEEHTQLELELAPDLPPVVGDPTLLEQILINLVVNASGAMPEGGAVRVSTAMQDPGFSERRRHGVRPQGRFVELQVCDVGCGMDDETLSRLFEPFYTTKQGQGTGLGLSIVYNAVQQCGGRIDVRSKPGDGATFSIHLPVAE
ncbi:MAG: GAF domain-containing protein [Deltaproteobacteria bacterium]|nr:GAF domain-containing protein [Deltaproteobacteria bacterium]MBW2419675.1 GAF domain-containing protein [Deltaproteobacteria bacterium]